MAINYRNPGKRGCAWTLAMAFAVLCAFPFQAQAALQTNSTIDLAPNGNAPEPVGYPFWYRDFNGLTLTFCDDPQFCLANIALPPPNAQPNQDGFEDFYMILESPANPFGAFYRAALEMSTFENPGLPAGIERNVFYRVRFRLDVTVPGTYTLTHPFGTKTYVGVPAGINAINDTVDLGVAPDNFAAVLPLFGGPAAAGFPNGGQFPTWTADLPAPPPGFIGNFFIAHPITPGPFGDRVRIAGPANAFGLGVDSVEFQNLHLAGKILGNIRPNIFSPDKTAEILTTRLSDNVTKVLRFVDPNGGPLSAVVTGLPAFCASDNTVANRVSISCDPILSTAQGTTPVLLTVTDNTGLQDNVAFNVRVDNLAPTVDPIPPTVVLNVSTDNVAIPIVVSDIDNNAIVSFTATITPTPSDNSWFRFTRTGPLTGRVNILGPIPPIDGNRSYSIDVHVTDDGNPTRLTETAASLQVTNAPAIIVQQSGGGGCSASGGGKAGLDSAAVFAALLLLGLGFRAARARRRPNRGPGSTG